MDNPPVIKELGRRLPQLGPLAWLREELPPIIARKDVRRILGGILAPNTLCNDDRRGRGPARRIEVNGGVAYPRDYLLEYLERKGVNVIDVPQI